MWRDGPSLLPAPRGGRQAGSASGACRACARALTSVRSQAAGVIRDLSPRCRGAHTGDFCFGSGSSSGQSIALPAMVRLQPRRIRPSVP